MHTHPADVDEICREIGLVVSPVRTSSFEIVSHLMLSVLGDRVAADAGEIDRLLATFTDCEQMLESGVARGFVNLALPVPEELEVARVAARAASIAMHRKLRGIAGGYIKSTPATFHDIAREINVALRPAIGEFLKALNDFARRESARRQNETRGIVAKTIAEIEKISLSIKLISINASVEAAHAGAAGAGFAVIASEIRSLSSKAQDSLDEIKRKLI